MRFVEAGDHRTAQTTGALLRRTMEQTHRKPGGATDSPHHFVRAVRAVVDEENFGRRGGKALLQPLQEGWMFPASFLVGTITVNHAAIPAGSSVITSAPPSRVTASVDMTASAVSTGLRPFKPGSIRALTVLLVIVVPSSPK